MPTFLATHCTTRDSQKSGGFAGISALSSSLASFAGVRHRRPLRIVACLLLIAFVGLFRLRSTASPATGEYGEKNQFQRGQHSNWNIVAFGGGDVATNNRQSSAQDLSWTEYMCKELGCRHHASFVPQTVEYGGALVSNEVYEDALRSGTKASRRAKPQANNGNDNGNGSSSQINYNWISKTFPVPVKLPDLKRQVDGFLSDSTSASLPKHQSHRTLWVFNIGYWDIWNLAALPRDPFPELIESNLREVLSQIERLYKAASNSVGRIGEQEDTKSRGIQHGDHSSPRQPFRIFIPRVFDISLTPGFEQGRPKPAPPDSTAEHLRNAVYLAKQWDLAVDRMLDSWIKTPDPVSPDNLLARQSSPNPHLRREVITFHLPNYVRERIADGHLRRNLIQDANGFGALPGPQSFVEVSQSCVTRNKTKLSSSYQGENTAGLSVCQNPDDHLFWTEFTVGQRAAQTVGKQAAERFSKHDASGLQWLQKWADSEDPAAEPQPRKLFRLFGLLG